MTLYYKKFCVIHTYFALFYIFCLKWSQLRRPNFVFVAWLLKIAKEHDCSNIFGSNSVKLPPQEWNIMKFPCFWPEKYENKKLCVSCVALHKKHVCNLCTHKNNMCVTCVLYLKIEVEKSTCVYSRYLCIREIL